jgi:hypothetical protein
MSTVKELEKAITGLPPEQLAEFRAWFETFDAARWDRQIEEDVKSGKLDRVAEKAIGEYRKGKAKPI